MIQHRVGKRQAPHGKAAVEMACVGKILQNMRRKPAGAVFLDDYKPVMRRRQAVQKIGIQRLGKTRVGNGEPVAAIDLVCCRQAIGKARAKRQTRSIGNVTAANLARTCVAVATSSSDRWRSSGIFHGVRSALNLWAALGALVATLVLG